MQRNGLVFTKRVSLNFIFGNLGCRIFVQDSIIQFFINAFLLLTLPKILGRTECIYGRNR